MAWGPLWPCKLCKLIELLNFDCKNFFAVLCLFLLRVSGILYKNDSALSNKGYFETCFTINSKCWWFFSSFYVNDGVLMWKAVSCDMLPEEIWCSQERSLRDYMKFEHQFLREPITHRAWYRRTLLFLLYNAEFRAKIATIGHLRW